VLWEIQRKSGTSHGIRLLDRAAEVGLLTAHDAGCYSIHPAVPWFFRRLFEERDSGAQERALRAYAEAMGSMGNYYLLEYQKGNTSVIGVMCSEEPNLLNARLLARFKGWWDPVVSSMQGLRQLYHHTGRRADWARLVKEIVPDFVDTATEGPFMGREEGWSFVTHYRVALKREARQWAEAERLQTLSVERDRRRAQDSDLHSVRALATSLHELAEIRREMGRPDCLTLYMESFDLAQQAGDGPGAAVVAGNLGNAYVGVRDLAKANTWYRKSLELTAETDRMGRARSLGQLGRVAYEHFLDGRRAGKPIASLAGHLADALRFSHQAF